MEHESTTFEHRHRGKDGLKRASPLNIYYIYCNTLVVIIKIYIIFRSAVRGSAADRNQWGSMPDWSTQVEGPAEQHKINKHQAIEQGPHGIRGRFLPVVLSTYGRLSPETVRLLGLLSHLQVRDFLSARGPGWDPDQHAQWIAAVCGRFFQRVKSRFTTSVAVATALRLLPPQPHPARSLFPSVPLPLTDYDASLFFPSQPDPVPAPPG